MAASNYFITHSSDDVSGFLLSKLQYIIGTRHRLCILSSMANFIVNLDHINIQLLVLDNLNLILYNDPSILSFGG
jgi:hypothetical protein